MNTSRLFTYASLAIFVLAAWFLHRELADLDFHELLDQLRASSPFRIAAAAVFATAGYLLLTAYDVLAMRYIGKTLRYSQVALTSFMAFAVGNNVGIATLSGGAIRYRMYSALGLSAADIARIVLFCSLTFALGTTSLLGGALWLTPADELSAIGIPGALAWSAGFVLLAAAVGYVVLPFIRHAPINAFGWPVDIPRAPVAVLQFVVSTLDILMAAATLYILVSPDVSVHFMVFLGVYLVAISAGLLSNVPGGIGVFEAIILLAFPDAAREVLLSKIILYRLIYYIAPLVLALVIMAAHEVLRHRTPLRAISDRVADGLSIVAPQIMGTAVFLSGMVLLVSGASPAIEARLQLIGRFLPQSVLELSHLAGSVIGLCLLVLARGLFRRLRGAHRVVSILLLVGALVSLLKGFDYEEATILVAAFGLLQVTRDEFRRQGSLLQQRYSAHWVVVILIALIGTAWVGIASYRHVPYSNELWWQFSLDSNAPRMLRALLLVCVCAIAFAVAKLIRPQPPREGTTGPDALASARGIVEFAEKASANAALIGDKRFLFNEAGTAFIMYQISGRSWIAFGDPVGPADEREALTWQFYELCDRYDAWPAFYQVSEKTLPIYIDMGLTLSKLGEEALVPLEGFSLDGKERADLRQARNRAERTGASFSVMPGSKIAGMIPELKAVSDAWLAQKGAAEKGFSLGRFTPGYVAQFDCAIVSVAGKVVAFANLWQARAGGELSIDLMRYDETAPKGVMDYLFAELMLWGREQGFSWFNLGMAPLSGLEAHPLAPLWHRVGGLIFRHGEDFYNFEGLRHYKEKFQPIWHSQYLASPGGLALPRVFVDASVLISGGLTRMVSR